MKHFRESLLGLISFTLYLVSIHLLKSKTATLELTLLENLVEPILLIFLELSRKGRQTDKFASQKNSFKKVNEPLAGEYTLKPVGAVALSAT